MVDFVDPTQVLQKSGKAQTPTEIHRQKLKDAPGGAISPYRQPGTGLVHKRILYAERRMQMAMMMADGFSQAQIAAHFGVEQPEVSAQLDRLVKEYQAKALESIGKKIAKEIAILDMVGLEATYAWFESKEGKKTSNRKRAVEIRAVLATNGKNTAVKHGSLGKKRANIEAPTEYGPPEDDLDEIFGAAAAGDPSNGLSQQNTKDEEYERVETSAGRAEFLKIIIECSDKRAKLQALYPKGDGTGGDEDKTVLTPQQRYARLTSLAQDLKLKKALAEKQQLPLDAGRVSLDDHVPEF